MAEVTVAQLEWQKQQHQAAILRMEQVKRLIANKDFETFIMKGFCEKDAARYVQEAGDPMLPKENREDALNMAMASGHLKRYLAVTLRMGETSLSSMDELDAMIEQTREMEDHPERFAQDEED